MDAFGPGSVLTTSGGPSASPSCAGSGVKHSKILFHHMTRSGRRKAAQPAFSMQRAIAACRTLAMIYLCCCCRLGAAANPIFAASATPLLRSDELGVSVCSLPGIMPDGEDVLLRTWLRLVVVPGWSNNPSRLLVRGVVQVVRLRSSEPHDINGGPQLQHTQGLRLINPALTLRSTQSGQVNALSLLRTLHQRTPLHVLQGDFSLHPDDSSLLDYELRADGFSWHCVVMVEAPALLAGGVRHADVAASGAGLAPGPRPSIEATRVVGLRAQLSSAAPTGLVTWSHYSHSTYSSSTTVWMLFSPFFGVDLAWYAKMLWYHILWHQPMGMHKYLLYINERATGLLREPAVQGLLSAGRLQLVLFLDLPKHEMVPLNPNHLDNHLIQAVIQEHALLALWGSDTLLLNAGIDEYLITPRPMTVVQLWMACRSHSARRQLDKPVSVFRIARSRAMCRRGVSAKLCSGGQYMQVWRETDPGAVLNGTAQHPMTTISCAKQVETRAVRKPIVDPNLTLGLHVHGGVPAEGSALDDGKLSCALWVHLSNMLDTRSTHDLQPEAVFVPTRDWWWPGQQIAGSR